MTTLVEISKRGPRLTPEQKAEQKKERTQARVGLGSNVLGLTAGAAATGSALRNPDLAGGGKIARGLYKIGEKIPAPIQRLNSKLGARGKAAMAGGALALQAGNMGGDVVANRVLARSAKQGEPVKKGLGGPAAAVAGTAYAGHRKKEKSDGERMLDAYISKADHTQGRGNFLRDEDYGREIDRARDEIKPRLQRRGTVAGAAYGGTLGSLAMFHPSAIKSGKRIAAAGIGGALAGGVLGGAAGHAAGSRAWNKAEYKLRNDPETRRAAERAVLIRRHNERALDKWARKQVRRQDVGKAYRRYDPEADRQRRLGLAAGAGVGGAALLGGAAAKKYTRTLQTPKGEKVIGLAVKPGKGKGALLLTSGALASGGLGALAYRKGLSERNNPWN